MSWRTIADAISERIASGELGPGARVEAEEEMAARLGVSRHTAHRALHELQRQGLVIRQRRWGTVVAQPQSQAAKNRIGYLVDWTGNRFQSEVMAHIENALDPGTHLVVATSRNDHEREAEKLQKLSADVDGVICYPCDGDANAKTFLALAESGYPIVLVDRAPRGCEDLVVLTDNVSATHEAVEDLISRGHKYIAFFGTNNPSAQSIRERFVGYRSAIASLDYASKPYERWVTVHLGGNDESMAQSVFDALVAMRNLPNPPTAAFCVQDWLTVALMEACDSLGLDVGVDFGIATYNDFGDTFFRQSWRLDRVVQQMDLVSKAAIERLNALMGGETIEKGPVRVPARFMPAQTTRDVLVSSLNAPFGATLP